VLNAGLHDFVGTTPSESFAVFEQRCVALMHVLVAAKQAGNVGQIIFIRQFPVYQTEPGFTPILTNARIRNANRIVRRLALSAGLSWLDLDDVKLQSAHYVDPVHLAREPARVILRRLAAHVLTKRLG